MVFLEGSLLSTSRMPSTAVSLAEDPAMGLITSSIHRK